MKIPSKKLTSVIKLWMLSVLASFTVSQAIAGRDAIVDTDFGNGWVSINLDYAYNNGDNWFFLPNADVWLWIADSSGFIISDLGSNWNEIALDFSYDNGNDWYWLSPSNTWGWMHDPNNDQPVTWVSVKGGIMPEGSDFAGVDVSGFSINIFEVTWGEWKEVQTWASNNGYNDIGIRGDGCADDHPVHSVGWDDVLKWCNAKSEKEGLSPVYLHGGNVHRDGAYTDVTEDGDANGYRIPREVEWEFAARGGNSSQGYTYAGSNELNDVGWYIDNSMGATCDVWQNSGTWPVGQKAPNELGLYDMSGNVAEWCFDAPSGSFYRRARGGGWVFDAGNCTVTFAETKFPSSRESHRGFRLARSGSGK